MLQGEVRDDLSMGEHEIAAQREEPLCRLASERSKCCGKVLDAMNSYDLEANAQRLRTPDRERVGMTSLRSGKFLPLISGRKVWTPVTLPPGRARLAASPPARDLPR